MSQSETTLSLVGSPDDATTVLAAGTHVVGRLSGQEDMRVHGTVEGRIHLAATLFIEPEGIVAADVHAHDIVVAGTVVGNLTATGSVVLASSARVVGDLRTPRLVVAPGAAFRGQVSMDPPDEDELVDESATGRGRAESRRAHAAAHYARPAAPARPTSAPVGLRMPPQRPANTVRRPDAVVVKHPALRDHSALRDHAAEAYNEAEEAEWGDGVKRAKKVARPRVLARGKHKIERL